MAYIVPSVQVYQTLANPGGAIAATPDLNTVIVGPLYNVVRANLNDPSDLERSKIKTTNFDFYNSANVLGSTFFEFELPSKILGQKINSESITVVLKNAWVNINNFITDMSALTGEDTSTVTVTAASENFAFTSTAPDGNLHIKKGDRAVYTVNVGGVPVTRTTTVRDFDITGATKTVRFSNNVGVIDEEQTLVSVELYRFFSSIEVPLNFAKGTGNIIIDEADINYYISLDTDLSMFPAVSPFYTVGIVESLHVGYRALRTDKSQTILTITSELNRESVLGEATHDNPLSLAVQLALANTTGVIKALSIQANDSSGYAVARDVLESDSSVYALVPLTQEPAITAAFQAHVGQLSTPVEASWRVLLANTKIPTYKYLAGQEDNPAFGYVRQLNPVGTADDTTFFIDPDVDFLTAGVVPTDIVTVPTFTLGVGQTLPSGTTEASFIGSWKVVAVIDSNTLKVAPARSTYTYTTTAVTPQSNGQFVPYTVYRVLTVAKQAKYIADVSAQFNDKRVWHIQPDSVTVEVNGVATPNLPGYYLCAALGGMVAGFPVQQGFTNIGVAGIVDLQHSNYYFTRGDLNAMAETGTCLFVQAVQGGIPYCRHELTTDVTVLEYREMLKVKNWDFLSYFYYDKLKSFIGKYNITADTLNDIRATLIAASELLMTQKLPRIGAPLVSYEIVTLEQDSVNKDRIKIKLRIEIVSPANYIDIELEI